MTIGFIGLGKMGSRMASKLLREGHSLAVWNRSKDAIEEFKIQNAKFKITIQNLKVAETMRDLIKRLEQPRIVWAMVPAGDATEEILKEVSKFVEKDDIVIDGGNSNFKDTQTRFEQFKKRGIRFLGIGVSGGIIAAKEGYPMMVGGDMRAYEFIKPILDSLAKPNGGHEYFGTGGGGHFVKMVHNGIEYGIMQSLGEGFGVLQKSSYNLDLIKIAKLYQKGTLVSGFMLDRTAEALLLDPKLSNIQGIIAESGEARWTIEEAEKENAPVPIIKESLRFRTLSQVDERVQNSFAARLVAALRQAFGGHEIKRK